MNFQDLLHAGNLSEVREELTQKVKKNPTDMQLRTYLFEVLSFQGEFQRAGRQLDVVSQYNADNELATQMYKNILQAELQRQEVFQKGVKPHFVFDEPEYVALHIEAIQALHAENFGKAKELLDRSAEMRQPVKAQVNGKPCSEFLDGDDRIGPFLEAIVNQVYLWIPFEDIGKITISAPKFLRDLLWIPAQLESPKGPIGPTFLPVLYPESYTSDQDFVRLGRTTIWEVLGDAILLGKGQHSFMIDGNEQAMLEVREIEFEQIEPPASN